MTPREFIDELGEALGICDESILLKRINRAVEVMAAKSLFDPLIGYLNFNVSGSNFIALPREVRTVLEVNINNQPSFARSRFYEFDLNTPGTVTGDSVEFEWSDRCNVCVQDSRSLPATLRYRVLLNADNGKTLTVEGRDSAGRIVSETLTGAMSNPVMSSMTFHEVTRIYREETSGGCVLESPTGLVGQYYPDETEPVYRSIRLAKSAASVRIMFRREPLRITSLDSFIPLNSPMAMIQAAKAVGNLIMGEDDMADACLARAEKFIMEDQASREEGDKLASDRQAVGTLGVGIGRSEGVTVMDVYDTACEIFGRQGQQVIFKKITQALQALLNKAHWDGMLGDVDIWTASNKEEVNRRGGSGHGYYVLPRFCGIPLKINVCGTPLVPRNKWFDFHLNGTGERNLASIDRWDDLGDVVISGLLPLERGTGKVIPVAVTAVCENALDEGRSVMIYGREMVDGEEREVWRDGSQGWACPCLPSLTGAGVDAPLWTSIDRIQRAASRGMVRLSAILSVGDVQLVDSTELPFIDSETGKLLVDSSSLMALSTKRLGLWYPDETEPIYRMIRVPSSHPKRIRVLYRKRFQRITSLFDYVPLRSSLAIENMLRAMKAQELGLIQQADPLEMTAIRYLSEDRIKEGQSEMPTLEFDNCTMPGGFDNIT